MYSIEKLIDVIVELRTTPKTCETFDEAKNLSEIGLNVLAVYDNTCTIIGKCTPTIFGMLMANPIVKSIEQISL